MNTKNSWDIKNRLKNKLFLANTKHILISTAKIQEKCYHFLPSIRQNGENSYKIDVGKKINCHFSISIKICDMRDFSNTTTKLKHWNYHNLSNLRRNIKEFWRRKHCSILNLLWTNTLVKP